MTGGALNLETVRPVHSHPHFADTALDHHSCNLPSLRLISCPLGCWEMGVPISIGEMAGLALSGLHWRGVS